MIEVKVSDEIKKKCPNLRLGCILCDVNVTNGDEALWEEMQRIQEILKKETRLEEVSQHAVNAQTRDAYRTCGKKPGRYRPSAEALMRRVLQGKDLYQINNVVDTLNMISIQSGFSIGGYDADKIQGEVLLGIGEEGEPYTGLGRGALNIHKLPVFRDGKGAFGTPTSDSERTGVTGDTKRFLMIILDFGGNEALEKTMSDAIEYLRQFAKGNQFESLVAE